MPPRRATPDEMNPWRWYLPLGRWALGWTSDPAYVFIRGHRRVIGRLWRRAPQTDPGAFTLQPPPS